MTETHKPTPGEVMKKNKTNPAPDVLVAGYEEGRYEVVLSDSDGFRLGINNLQACDANQIAYFLARALSEYGSGVGKLHFAPAVKRSRLFVDGQERSGEGEFKTKSKNGGHLLMNKSTVVSTLLAVVLMFSAASLSAATKKKEKASSAATEDIWKGSGIFAVFTDAHDPANHYIPSGWMGDYSDMLYTDQESSDPYMGKNCIKITYKAKGSQGWAGIFWQNPANNWGTKKGFNLTGAKKLTFYAKGEKGGEVLAETKVGGIKGEYADSDDVTVKNIVLTKEWKAYTINLDGKDMTSIIGGFCVVFNKDGNPEGATIYLDNIVYSNKSGSAKGE